MMPTPMGVLPADSRGSSLKNDQGKPLATGGGKSRLKRLFERQFPTVLRISSSEKLVVAGDGRGVDRCDGGNGDPEPSSVCLDKMVLSFMEESNEKLGAGTIARCGRSRCNCFNGNCDDSSDDEFSVDLPSVAAGHSGDAVEILRGLVPCASITERNLLADASKIVEKSKIVKGKTDFRKIASVGLRDLGYDASICKSFWEKSPSFPAGEHEYVDVIVDAERFLIDVDFRSEFEIARSTKNYRTLLQMLPTIFVGKEDRLQQIVAVVSEAARQSLKKKGLHFPPWRKPEYMRAKWLSPYQRDVAFSADGTNVVGGDRGKSTGEEMVVAFPISAMSFSGEFQIRTGSVGTVSGDGQTGDKITVVVSPWQPPVVKPKVVSKAAGSKVVAGLASVLREKEKPPSP